ncbi:MAG: hypothetical protein L0387_37915 [Acidobacteria bacterium]|nr:hypothetical protein [Acidobacteriota bacterium]MCI0627362.1 hypothetical protein [Acidobacteriota bacterium]
MTASLTAEVLQDDLAVSLARAVAAANRRARELGVDVLQNLVTITQRKLNDESFYGGSTTMLSNTSHVVAAILLLT